MDLLVYINDCFLIPTSFHLSLESAESQVAQLGNDGQQGKNQQANIA